MAQSTITAAETTGAGSRKTPQLAAICGVNAHWLATGEGEMVGAQAYDPSMGSGGALLAAMDAVSKYASPGQVTRALAQSLSTLPASRRQLIGRAIADAINDPDEDQAESIDLLAPNITVAVQIKPTETNAGAEWRRTAFELANEALGVADQQRLIQFFAVVDRALADKEVTKPARQIQHSHD